MSEADEEVSRLEKQLDEAEEQTQKLQYRVSDLEMDQRQLQEARDQLQQDKQRLEGKLEQVRRELALERERIQQSVRPLSGSSPVPLVASTPDALGGVDLEDFTNQIEQLQQQLDAAEMQLRDEKEAHDVTRQEVDDLRAKVGLSWNLTQCLHP